MDQPLIVQFIHPGKEHDNFNLVHGVPTTPWNDISKKHRRKFLVSRGEWVSPSGDTVDGQWARGEDDLMFWGEWEPESEQDPRGAQIQGLDGEDGRPKFLVKPYWRSREVYEGLHNTDPFVFETSFKYLNCLQNGRMTNLPIGSMILFGSEDRRNRRFTIDTVFVVGGSTPYTTTSVATDLEGIVSETYFNVAVLRRSRASACGGSHEANPRDQRNVQRKICGDLSNPSDKPRHRRLYYGATFDSPVNGMFSFFPCRTIHDQRGAFARPAITIDNLELDTKGHRVPVVDPAFFNGKRYTVYVDPDDIAKYWHLVALQVRDVGLLLGVEAETPSQR